MTPIERAQIKQIVADFSFILAPEGMDLPSADHARLRRLCDSLAELAQQPSHTQHLWFLGCGEYAPSGRGLDKIGAIKAVRWLTNIGLMEAKNLVESAPHDLGAVDPNHPAVIELLRDHHVEWRDA